MPTILLVEDDRMNREMLARRLEWEGYHVVVAASGMEAITIVQTEPPDLILMDVGLPILDGWQTTRKIKDLSPPVSIPVIVLTAYATIEDRQKSFDSGCDEYEVKPINFERLLSKMRALLH